MLLVWLPAAYPSQFEDVYHQHFEALANAYDHVDWTNWHQWEPKATYFFDEGHLNIYGATHFTDAFSHHLITHPNQLQLTRVEGATK